MKNIFCLFALMGVAATEAAVTVSDVAVRQNWPWNSRLDVTCRVTGASTDAAYDLELVATANGGVEYVVSADEMPMAARFVQADGALAFSVEPEKTSIKKAGLLRNATWSVRTVPSRLYMIVNLDANVDPHYRISYTNCVVGSNGRWDDTYKSNNLVLRFIPKGSYIMQEGKSAAHRVTLTKSLYCGVFEVTGMQWYLVMGSWCGSSTCCNAPDRAMRPAHRMGMNVIRGGGWPNGNPIHTVTDNTFFGQLRAKTANAFVFDLPTEAQWEYVCRAGTTTDYYNGYNCGGDPDANLEKIGSYWQTAGKTICPSGPDSGWIDEATRKVMTADEGGPKIVGSYEPNAWGIYDMLGNAGEVCLDKFKDLPTDGREAVDPVGPTESDYNKNGTLRVVRGGSWNMAPSSCTCFWRHNHVENWAATGSREGGVRVFCEVP